MAGNGSEAGSAHAAGGAGGPSTAPGQEGGESHSVSDSANGGDKHVRFAAEESGAEGGVSGAGGAQSFSKVLEADARKQLEAYNKRAAPLREYAARASEARSMYGAEFAREAKETVVERRTVEVAADEEEEGGDEVDEDGARKDPLVVQLEREKREKERSRSEKVSTIAYVAGEGRDTTEADLKEMGNQAVEPFNLKDEREDGYFTNDGVFVWKKDEGRKEDEWLEGNRVMDAEAVKKLKEREAAVDEAAAAKRPVDQKALARTLAAHLEPGETVRDAVRRLSGRTNSRKRGRGGAGGSATAAKKRRVADSDVDTMDVKSLKRQLDIRGVRYGGALEIGDLRDKLKGVLAKERQIEEANAAAADDVEADPAAMNAVIEAADGLLQDGVTDAYELTFEKVYAAISGGRGGPSAGPPVTASTATASGGEEMWEYKMDPSASEIQGPFSATQMREWKAQGFFTGDYVVYARPVQPAGKAENDDLMADLDDLADDDAGAEEAARAGASAGADSAQDTSGRPASLPGGWKRSDLLPLWG